jgi:hypothetical protein
MAVKTTAFGPQPEVGSFDRRWIRADFRKGDFDSLIETKTARLGWARAAQCSCTSLSGKTDQPDPTCPKCNALGLRYFRPPTYAVDTNVFGTLNSLQTKYLTEMEAVGIRGFISGLANQPSLWEAVGEWGFGTATLTVRPMNRLGYYDRIVQLDSLVAYTEFVTVAGEALKTKYPVHEINFLASVDARYGDADIALSDDGVLSWRTGKSPPSGTRLSIHYHCHPVWVVVEHMNTVRQSLVATRLANPQTPDGDILDLPMRVFLKREHLVTGMKEKEL